MSATTDAIQVTTGIAALVVSVLALRESMLQRRTVERAAAPPSNIGPAAAQRGPQRPPPLPTGYTPPPGLPTPTAYPAPVPYTPPAYGPAAASPQWRMSRVIPYAVLAGMLFGVLSSTVLTGTAAWLISSVVLLGVAIALFARSRSAPAGETQRLGFAAGCVGGASLAIASNVFFPPDPFEDTWVVDLVLLAILVTWIVVNRIRDRQAGYR